MNILRKSLVLTITLSLNVSIGIPPAAARMAAAVVRTAPMPIGQSGAAAAGLAVPNGLSGGGISLPGMSVLPAITAPSLLPSISFTGAPSAPVLKTDSALLAPAPRNLVPGAILKTATPRTAPATKPGVLGGLTQAAAAIKGSMTSGRFAGVSKSLDRLFGERWISGAPRMNLAVPARDAKPDRQGSVLLNGKTLQVRIYGTGWNVKRVVVGEEEFSIHSQSRGELNGSLVVRRNGRVVEEKSITVYTDPERVEWFRQNYKQLAEEWDFTNKDEIAPAEGHNAFILIGDDHNEPYPMIANFAEINDYVADPSPALSSPKAGADALRYAKGGLTKIEEIGESIAGEKGIGPRDMTSRQFADIMAEAAKRYRATAREEAPSQEAFDTVLAVQEQVQRIYEAAAGVTKTYRELKNKVMGDMLLLMGLLQEAPTLSDMRRTAKEAADDITSRLGGTGGKITAAKLPGIYAAKPAIPGPYLAVEMRVKEDNTYTFRQGNLDEVSPAFEGTWELKDGVFIGRLNVPGFDEPVIQEIDLKGKTMADLKNGVQVMVKSSLYGGQALPFNIRKTDKPFFPE